MDIVNFGGRDGEQQLARQLVGWLGGHLTRATTAQINALAQDVAHDIVMGGGEALGGIRGTISEFVRNNGWELTTNMRNWIEETSGALWEVGRQVVENTNAEWADMIGEGGLSRERAISAPENDWQRPVIDRQPDNWGTHGEELPDLEDLIPENAEQGRGRQGQPGAPRGPVMEATTDDTTPIEGSTAMAARSGGGGPSTVSKETPISPYPSLSYGLQETHTTILPWTGWMALALNNNGGSAPEQLKIRMNSPHDMIDVTFDTEPAAGAAYTAPGFYVNPSGDAVRSSTTFPKTFTTPGPTTTERPAWRDFWGALYDYYTVLGCEYEVTIENPVKTDGADIICALQYDTYSSTATTTGNVMPLDNMADVMAFKNIKWYNINANTATTTNNRNNVQVIRGTYKPGQAKRNIVNDGDVKTWSATGAAPTTLVEMLTLNFWRAPMAYATAYNANLQIRLKYIVQYKDLKLQARYPSVVTTDQDITIVLNETRTNANGLQNW